MSEKPKVGDRVMYHDPKGNPFNALVTTVWSQTENPLVNLVFVSGDENRQDGFGRQLERATSVGHKSGGVHGYYWRRPDEEPNAYVPPASV